MTQPAASIRSIHTNWENAVLLYGGEDFVYGGKLWALPGNIADGPPELKGCFISQLTMARDVFYTMGVPKDRLEGFLKNRTKKILENCPPDPLSKRMYAVAHAAVMFFVIAISCQATARL